MYSIFRFSHKYELSAYISAWYMMVSVADSHLGVWSYIPVPDPVPLFFSSGSMWMWVPVFVQLEMVYPDSGLRLT